MYISDFFGADAQLPTEVNLQCTSGECVTDRILPPGTAVTNQANVYGIAAISVGSYVLLTLLITLILTCVFSIWHARKAKYEWETILYV